MKKIKGDKDEKTVFIDCDDTLVMWEGNHTQPSEGKIELKDPYDNSSHFLYPHFEHVRLVKHFSNRGYFVVVWSASGGKWAEVVVKNLNLEEYVDMTMCKPLKYVDDLSSPEWMGNRVYITYKGKA